MDWICYTDGSVRKTPTGFLGGWSYVLLHPASKTIIEKAEGVPKTTISRMEFVGPLEAIKKVAHLGSIHICSDSQYVVNTANEWMHKWKRWNWTKDGFEPPKHLDLIKELDHLMSIHTITFQWVRGHTGNPGNERADKLATTASKALKRNENSFHYAEYKDGNPIPLIGSETSRLSTIGV